MQFRISTLVFHIETFFCVFQSLLRKTTATVSNTDIQVIILVIYIYAKKEESRKTS